MSVTREHRVLSYLNFISLSSLNLITRAVHVYAKEKILDFTVGKQA